MRSECRANGTPIYILKLMGAPGMRKNSMRGRRESASKSERRLKKPPRNRAPAKVSHGRLSTLKRSPENDKLYKPVDPKDPEIIALAESIRRNGVREPLVITKDKFIVSGHRRHVAAAVAGLKTVPMIEVDVRRRDDLDAFVRLLREHNRQRDKTAAEKLREEIVSVSPADAYSNLQQYRRAKAALNVVPLDLGDIKVRKNI